jgi:hypothetical protein
MQSFRYPASASVSINSQGQNGDPAPIFSLQVGGEDPGGDLQPLQINSSGELIVTIGSGITNPLPVEDLAAEASLASIDGKLGSLGQKAMAGSAPVVIASDQSTLPVSAASLPLPAGAATLAEQQTQTTALGTLATEATLASVLADTSSIDGKTPALGQALMAASSPVVIASDQSTLPISAASLPLPAGAASEVTSAAILVDTSSIDAKTPSLGQALMAASVPVTLASDQSTLPVSIASSPLPTGAATLAEQQSQTTLLGTIDADTGAIATSTASIDTKTPALGQALMAASVPVVLASDQSDVPVSSVQLPSALGSQLSAASLSVTFASDEPGLTVDLVAQSALASPVPAQAIYIAGQDPGGDLIGIATDGAGAIKMVIEGASLNVPVDVQASVLPTGAATEATSAAISGKLPATLGQKTMANSMAVVLASDQSSIPVAATISGTPSVNATPVVPAALTVKSAGVSVGTTAVRLTTDGSAPSSTRRVLLANVDSANASKFYIGPSSVTAGTGVLLVAGQTFSAEDDAGDYYIISNTAAQTVFVTEQE